MITKEFHEIKENINILMKVTHDVNEKFSINIDILEKLKIETDNLLSQMKNAVLVYC